MPDIWMDVDAAVTVPCNILPLVASSDGKTIADNTIAYNETGLEVYWNFVTTAGAQTCTPITPTTSGDYDWTHVDGGMYKIEIPASGGASANNDTEGFGWITGACPGGSPEVLPFRGPTIGFRAAALNNSLVDGTTIDVNVTAMAANTVTATAIATGAIDADAIASDAIAAAKIATGAITNAKFAAGAIDAAAIANNAIDLATFAADVKTGSALKANVETVTANAITAAAIADGAIDAATFAADALLRLGIVTYGTAQAAGATSIQLAAASAFADDELNGAVVVITGGTGVGQSRVITDYVGSTDTATVDTWTTTPSGTITYVVFAAAPASATSLPAVNLTQIAGSAVSTSTAQLGVNVVQAAGTAWGSGAITAASIATGAIDADSLAADAVSADALSAAAVDKILDEVVEGQGSITLRQSLMAILAFAAGQASGGGTTECVFESPNGGATRITMTVNSAGDRSSVVLNFS